MTDWLYLETMNAWLEYLIQNDNGIEQQLGLADAIPASQWNIIELLEATSRA